MIRLLIFALIPSFALAAPTHRASPTPTPKGPVERAGMVCRTKQQDLELRDWINGLINQVHQAQAENNAAQKSNADTQAKLDLANGDLTKLKQEMAEGQQCVQHPLSFWFHRLMRHLFWILGGVVILIVGLLVLEFFFPFLRPIFSFLSTGLDWLFALIKPKPKPPTQ